MTPRRPGAVAAEARFLRENTDRGVKVCLPSPYLLGQRMWLPEHSTSAYPTRDEFCQALVPLLREELPQNVKVGLGCVDVRFPEIDTPQTIAARVQKALEHVATQRLWLNPDCGFAPGKDHEIPLEEAYLKLKNLASGAKLLRG